MVDFRNRLKKLRIDAHMTQSYLAARLRVTKSVVSYYELHARIPSPEILIKLARIFHVSTDYLLGLEHKQMLDVSDLSEEDIQLLIHTSETLRNKK